jgi:hypothetical protein
MTPREKAIELVDKYIPLSLRLYSEYEWVEEIDSAKQCALIAVDEMLSLRYLLKHETWFYKQVKKEINKL